MEFVGAIFSPLLERLIPLAEETLVGAWNVKKDLKDIRKNMEIINDVLEQTDKRALRDKLVQHWMSELRDVKYQMEDVIDDYEYERHQLTIAPFYKKPKRWMLCISITRRIKVIRKKLESIQKRSDQLDISKFGLNSDENPKNKHRADTQASPISANIVGHQVERNTEKVLKLVTEGHENERKVSIIAITGMGGVGKTTLAQNIYSKIKDMGTSFDITCWVSVTKDTDDVTLLKEMMESIDAEHNKGINSKVTLCENLQKFVKGDNFPRKFFIVLDDIWKADMYDKLLSGPLSHGAPGSKIIITTRDVDIPKKMQVSHIFSIDVLSEEDALSLLYMNVFVNESNEEDEKLKSIALQVVRKCAFLPLAIKAVGGVLRTKDRLEKEWKRIVNSDIWDLPDFDEIVKKLEIVDCSGLETIPELPTIIEMAVVDCLSIKQAGPFHSLEQVFWGERHGKIKCLPKWLGELCSGDAPSAPSLQSLRMDISDSHMIRRLDRHDVGFDWPLISDVPTVVVTAKSGDCFVYTKSPFLIHVKSRVWHGSDRNPVGRCMWSMDFVAGHRSLLPSPKQRQKAAERKPVKLNEHQKEDDTITPRETVPGTSWELMTKLASVLPTLDPESFTFYEKSTELPFRFHAHVEVITADDQTQILCIDQLPSAETGFLSTFPCHTHFPCTTAQGDSAVACFSHREDDLVRKWPSSNIRSTATTAMRP